MFPTRILVATDGSEVASMALRAAVELADGTGSELHVVHVVSTKLELPYPSVTARERTDALLEQRRLGGMRILERHGRFIEELGGHVFASHYKEGTPGKIQVLIATGLVPKRIRSFPDLPGIHVLRNVGESLALRREAADARRAVVVGAGFIGCEVAASLRKLGVDVVLVEPQPAPLASVLGEKIGELVTRLHRAEGVDVRLSTSPMKRRVT